MRRFKKAGFLLVVALLLTVLTAMLGLSLLGIRKASYASSQSAARTIQARALARSGIGDVWIKYSKDPAFPEGLGDEQTRFSYRETVTDLDRNEIGSYTVTLDRSDRFTTKLIRIESTGIVGSVERDQTRHTIYAELSIEAGDFRYKVWQEGTVPQL